MKNVILIAACVVALCTPVIGRRANRQPKTAEQVKKDVEQTQAIKTKIDEAQAQSNPRFVRTLTNVQIELTLTDQIGTAAPEKKTVSHDRRRAATGARFARPATSVRPARRRSVVHLERRRPSVRVG